MLKKLKILKDFYDSHRKYKSDPHAAVAHFATLLDKDDQSSEQANTPQKSALFELQYNKLIKRHADGKITAIELEQAIQDLEISFQQKEHINALYQKRLKAIERSWKLKQILYMNGFSRLVKLDHIEHPHYYSTKLKIGIVAVILILLLGCVLIIDIPLWITLPAIAVSIPPVVHQYYQAVRYGKAEEQYLEQLGEIEKMYPYDKRH